MALALVVVAVVGVSAWLIVGQGSSTPASSHSVAGVKATWRAYLTDVFAGRYTQACDTFTSGNLAKLGGEKGCTAGYTQLGVLFHTPRVEANLPKALKLLEARLSQSQVQIAGDIATSSGKVVARYEHGRWHLESPSLGSAEGQKNPAYDPQAMELARTAQTAAETYATEHGGSSAGLSATALHKIEPSIQIAAGNNSAYLSGVKSTINAYKVTATAATGGHTFSIERKGSGEVVRTCTPPGKTGTEGGGCQNGAW